MTFRIVRSDKKNWTLETLVVGGIHPITKQLGPDKWEVVGYYGKLEDLAKYLLNHQIELPDGTLYNQVKDLLVEMKRVEKSILDQLEKMNER